MSEDVFQFTYIPRPGMSSQKYLSLSRNSANWLIVLCCETLQKMTFEQGQILSAPGQSRQLDFDGGNSIVEILSKLLVCHHRAQIAIALGYYVSIILINRKGSNAMVHIVLQPCNE